MSDTYDYIVVGSGAAGSVIAARLSEDPRRSVCVLEAGAPDRNPLIHIPAGFMKTLSDPAVNWMYRSEPGEHIDGRCIATPRGKTLGGSTAINGNIYSRGLPADYDGWAQAGNRGWAYRDLLPYFRRAETYLGAGEDAYRGRAGELRVTDSDWRHPLCEAFIAGAQTLGIPPNPDYNGASQAGVSYTQRTIYQGRRVSAYRAFLHPRRGRANLTIRTGALVSRVRFEARRANGVVYLRAGSEHECRARREVILCAGAINSPQLLQLSGIGPGALLNDIGIAVRHELDGVGNNLRDHYAVRLSARVKGVQTINERSRGWRLAREVLRYYAGRPSILALPSTVVYAFWHSQPDYPAGDVQISFTPASYHAGVQNALDEHPGMSIAAWQQRPHSTGFVRLRSADPREPPSIQPNYLAAAEDRRVLLAAMRLGQAIVHSAPLAPYYDPDNTPALDAGSDADLLALARSRGTTAFHVMGTCRMGPAHDAGAVVDEQLRVHGVEGLRVADASIMPDMPSCNINAPTIAIGEKAADMIAGKPAPAPG